MCEIEHLMYYKFLTVTHDAFKRKYCTFIYDSLHTQVQIVNSLFVIRIAF